jgi:CheY-like chemotaxis protein
VVFERHAASWGMRPETVATAREGLDRLRAASAAGDPFLVAVIDGVMPEMSGFEMAKAILDDANLRTTRLLLLTASATRGDAGKAAKAGFDGFMTKPARPDALRRVLCGLVQMPEANRGTAFVTRHAAAESLAAAALAPRAPEPGPQAKRVLVVDDNTTNQKVAGRMLERLGYRVDVAGNGREAVELWTQFPYDVVLMDCQMPEVDGYEATRQIRARETGGEHVVIVALTASATDDNQELCRAAGMDGCLPKPVRMDTLKSALEGYLRVQPVTA